MGANGASSDSQIWNSSNLKGHIPGWTAGFHWPSTLSGYDKPYRHFIKADDAFAFRDWVMKSFGHCDHSLTEPERIFNYHLSRARQGVENAFVIM